MGFILDQPYQIQGWRLLALYHMLQLEILGMRHSSGRRASVEIRKVLLAEKLAVPRDRAALLEEYAKYLHAKDLLKRISPQDPCPHGFYNYCAVCGPLTRVTEATDERIDRMHGRTPPRNDGTDEPYLKDA